MEFVIANQLKQTIHNFKIGTIVYKNIVVDQSPQMLRGRLQLFQESIHFDLQETSITDIAEISEWRSTLKTIGTDPNRYRHSAESLYRRIQKQNFIPSIHSAADVNNFFSLYYKIPIGIYDLDKISGNITIDIGTNNDEYIGINGRLINFANKLISKDEAGPFGSPIVDSERTAVTLETRNAVQIIYLLPSMNIEHCNKLLSSMEKMFIQIHGGEAVSKVIQ